MHPAVGQTIEHRGSASPIIFGFPSPNDVFHACGAAITILRQTTTYRGWPTNSGPMEECPKTADEEIVGKTGDRGSMIRTKIRRMGGIVVFIGFVLLIPSFIGMGIGGLGLLGSGFIASQTSKSTPEVESDLRAAKVPEPMIIQLIEGAIPTSEQLSALPPTQMLAVQKAQFALHGKDLEPGILVGGCVAIIIASLVGGLLGWLLVMKKWVLRCTHCRAVLPAG